MTEADSRARRVASEQDARRFNNRLDNAYTTAAVVIVTILGMAAGCITGTMIRSVHEIGADYQPRITDTMNPGVAQVQANK